MDWFKLIKGYYPKYWDKKMVGDAVIYKKITEAQYKEITGEDYNPETPTEPDPEPETEPTE